MLIHGNVRRNTPEGKHQPTLFRTPHTGRLAKYYILRKQKSSSPSTVFCSPSLKVVAVVILFANNWPWIIDKPKKKKKEMLGK